MRYTPETYLTMKIRACNYTPVCDVDHQENIIDYEITTVVEKSAQGIEISGERRLLFVALSRRLVPKNRQSKWRQQRVGSAHSNPGWRRSYDHRSA